MSGRPAVRVTARAAARVTARAAVLAALALAAPRSGAAQTAGVSAERSITKIRPGLLGGIGGLVFAGLVVVQNAIRSGFPANDATTEEVMRYYADHRSATIALSVLFPIGLVDSKTLSATSFPMIVTGIPRSASFSAKTRPSSTFMSRVRK